MDILSPQLAWIGGRCYRVNKTNESSTDAAILPESVDDAGGLEQYVEKDLYDDADGIEDDGFDIVLLESNRFKSTFHVPKSFNGMLIGAKGTTRKRIESETKTVLKVPLPGADGDVEVMGGTRSAVASARRRIELIVIGARAKQEATHFVCVPVVSAAIKERFVQFKAAISSGPPVFGLDESMFQGVDKLHLTFGVLALMDNWDRKLADRLLQECQQTIVKPILQSHGGALEFRVAGVAYMNDDPSKVRVLYGQVECEPLQLIADRIVDVYVKHGLMQHKSGEGVKLHVTLINSRYRNNSGDYFDGAEESSAATESHVDKPSASRRRQAFDARQILQQFSSFDFGVQSLAEIHLSRRYTTSCETGFYDASSVLKVF